MSVRDLISITNLCKSYQRGSEPIPVLRDLSLAVPEGQFLALMGPSGSGKTTLLNILCGLDRADSGSVLVGEVEITRLGEKDLARWRSDNVGFVFQFYNLIPVLTAFENVELPLLLTTLTRADRRRHVSLALELMGLADRRDHLPSQLSGGQQQRVAIARALVTDPTIVAADEPTGDLDKRSAEEILALLARLNREFGKTILMVTHDARAAAVAGRVVNLDKGLLTEE